jgi:hypothetical protein
MSDLIRIDFKSDFNRLERALLTMAAGIKREATRQVVARTAALTRKQVMEELPHVFDRPTPWTVNAIRYRVSEEGNAAVIYVTDDRAKGISAQKFLRAEVMGGPRADKRSERALIARGLMEPDQQIEPGNDLRLDRYGNIPSGVMTRVLSGLGAHRETGFVANATARSRARFAKQKRAVRSTGTPFFVRRDRGGRPMGVYELMGRHHVRPVLVFGRIATYHARLKLQDLVDRFAAKIAPVQIRRVLHELAEGSFKVTK